MDEAFVGTEITREARLYAFKELARRAGVTQEFFRSWRIEIGAEETNIYVLPGTDKRICFKNASPTFSRELLSGTLQIGRADWMHDPPEPIGSLVPDFIVPFSSEPQPSKCPLFLPNRAEYLKCRWDLAVSILLTLSRVEETLTKERDDHGCFPESMGLAVRHGFVNRPIVDEYGLAFEQALTHLLPAWRPLKRELRVKLSHDIDQIGLPFSLRSALGHTLRRRKPLATIRDLLSWFPGLFPTYLRAVRQIVQTSLERGLDSAVYWKASPASSLDTGYDPRHPRVQEVIAWLHGHGVETGVHPGYGTFRCPKALGREIEILREALGKDSLGGRQHYLRWCPDTWCDWEKCGLSYDSSVGYNDHLGFRAGTCVPYHPWLLPVNREARLIEIPLIVMDRALLDYVQLAHHERSEAIREFVARCRAVGGVFTLLWHNNSLLEPGYDGLYHEILELLVGYGKFDWWTPSSELY